MGSLFELVWAVLGALGPQRDDNEDRAGRWVDEPGRNKTQANLTRALALGTQKNAKRGHGLGNGFGGL